MAAMPSISIGSITKKIRHRRPCASFLLRNSDVVFEVGIDRHDQSVKTRRTIATTPGITSSAPHSVMVISTLILLARVFSHCRRPQRKALGQRGRRPLRKRSTSP